MICSECAKAADYGVTSMHCGKTTCDCHHRPIEGEPRLKVAPSLRHGMPDTAKCLHCGMNIKLNNDGRMRRHKGAAIRGHVCPGSGVNYV